jgi:hypothetical protein
MSEESENLQKATDTLVERLEFKARMDKLLLKEYPKHVDEYGVPKFISEYPSGLTTGRNAPESFESCMYDLEDYFNSLRSFGVLFEQAPWAAVSVVGEDELNELKSLSNKTEKDLGYLRRLFDLNPQFFCVDFAELQQAAISSFKSLLKKGDDLFSFHKSRRKILEDISEYANDLYNETVPFEGSSARVLKVSRLWEWRYMQNGVLPEGEIAQNDEALALRDTNGRGINNAFGVDKVEELQTTIFGIVKAHNEGMNGDYYDIPHAADELAKMPKSTLIPHRDIGFYLERHHELLVAQTMAGDLNEWMRKFGYDAFGERKYNSFEEEDHWTEAEIYSRKSVEADLAELNENSSRLGNKQDIERFNTIGKRIESIWNMFEANPELKDQAKEPQTSPPEGEVTELEALIEQYKKDLGYKAKCTQDDIARIKGWGSRRNSTQGGKPKLDDDGKLVYLPTNARAGQWAKRHGIEGKGRPVLYRTAKVAEGLAKEDLGEA